MFSQVLPIAGNERPGRLVPVLSQQRCVFVSEWIDAGQIVTILASTQREHGERTGTDIDHPNSSGKSGAKIVKVGENFDRVIEMHPLRVETVPDPLGKIPSEG